MALASSIASGHNVCGCDYRPHPERVGHWHFTAHFHSPLHSPSHCQLRASLFSATQVPLRIATVADFGARDCALSLHYAFRRHPSKVGGWLAPLRLRLQTLFDGYILAYAATSGYAYGVGTLPFRCQSETYTCFSEPSMPVCYSPNSNGRGRHTFDTFLPPIEETTASIISPPAFFIIRLRQ